MAEYIDREAFREFWNKEFRHLYPNDNYLFALANFPAADVTEVRRGEWILETDEEMLDPMFKLVVCSNCNEKANHTYRFCPNCGADMKGKKDEEN